MIEERRTIAGSFGQTAIDTHTATALLLAKPPPEAHFGPIHGSCIL